MYLFISSKSEVYINFLCSIDSMAGVGPFGFLPQASQNSLLQCWSILPLQIRHNRVRFMGRFAHALIFRSTHKDLKNLCGQDHKAPLRLGLCDPCEKAFALFLSHFITTLVVDLRPLSTNKTNFHFNLQAAAFASLFPYNVLSS